MRKLGLIKKSNVSYLILLISLSFALANCTFYKPDQEVPVPDDNDSIRKTFFLGEAFSSGTEVSSKTFLCGWAPVVETGWAAHRANYHMFHSNTHCNVRFQITERALIAKRINPSFPDQHDKWANRLEIPSEKHYYLEAAKDGRGRDTNQLVENSSRSHWSRRPYIRLNLKGLNIKSGFENLLSAGWFWSGSPRIVDVYDVEWDPETGFLGLTVYAQSEQYGENLQGRIRVNFKAFEHNPNFVKTPMDPTVQKYMNILHIMGQKADGLYQLLYAAHWDLSKQHKVYLSHVPDKYIETVKNVVEKWNDAFVDVGAVPEGHKVFIPEVKELKYPFDLRYPSIYWVDDQEISARSPLGVGQTHADVRNGEILWGGIVIYGGMIERYINRYIAPSAPSSATMARISPYRILGLEERELPFPRSLDYTGQALAGFTGQSLVGDYRNLIQFQLDELQGQTSTDATNRRAELSRMLTDLNDDTSISRREIENIAGSLNSLIGRYQHDVQAEISNKSLEDYLYLPGYEENAETQAQEELLRSDPENSLPEIPEAVMAARNVFGLDRNFEMMSTQWMASTERGETPNVNDAIESVITDLTMHEYGHFLGLGHQFKGNLLPDPERVPPAMYQAMAEMATEEAGYNYFSSIMDYRHGTTEVHSDLEKIKPGEHDKLVLRYLYNQEYPGYKTGSGAETFSFFKVPADGRIPQFTCSDQPATASKPYNPNSGEVVYQSIPCDEDSTEAFEVAYFPSCNDMEASYYYDPMCNRWDRGTTYQEVANNYWKDLTDNLIQYLYSFTDNSAGADRVEGYLWYKAISMTGRIRLFYDYMRRKFEPEIQRISEDQQALYQFSTACAKENVEEIEHPLLREIFSQNSEFKDLCETNKQNIEEFKKILTKPLVDSTRYNHEDYYLPGGIRGGDQRRDFSRFLGTWSQMTNLPLKVSSLFQLMSPKVMTPFGYAFYYGQSDANYFMGSLYPREYTDTLGSALTSNLRFQSLGDEATFVGKAVSWMGYLSGWSRTNNDNHRFPLRYMEKIYDQTKLEPQVAVLILQGIDSGTPELYKRFKLTIFDPLSRKEIDGQDAYILPEGHIVARANDMIIYPLTPIKFFSDSAAYSFAYMVTINRSEDDQLAELGVKEKLLTKYNDVLKSCIEGDKGLNQYFTTTPQFEGFRIPKGIATSTELDRIFKRSIQTEFNKFEEITGVSEDNCFESTKGIAAALSAAGLLNGYWWFPYIFRVNVSE